MNQDELLALIDQIYEAAADSGRWPVVLQTIADAFGAGEASLAQSRRKPCPGWSRRAPIRPSCKATASTITR